ncbi:MAG: ArsR family transcriptional regulator [Gammaproteobacteria bacterium]|nr:ArsR family transcriptional regulator [Gammaproteobacteria bacterium]
MKYDERVRRDQRLVTLQLLERAEGYDLNASILRSALAEFGHRPSADALRAELQWLAEQGLITVREVVGLQVATLTERGADAAAGRATVPGVARPTPNAAG